MADKDALRKYGDHIVGECTKWYQPSDYSGWQRSDAECTCGWSEVEAALITDARASQPPAARAGAPRTEAMKIAYDVAQHLVHGNGTTVSEGALRIFGQAYLDLYDAAPEAPLPGQSAEGYVIVERVKLHDVLGHLDNIPGPEWGDDNVQRKLRNWINYCGAEAVKAYDIVEAMLRSNAAPEGYENGPVGPPTTSVGDSNAREGGKARDNSALTTPSPAGQGEAMREVLKTHWVTSYGCDPEPRHTDRTRVHCWCGWSSGKHELLGGALEEYTQHVLTALRASAQPTPPKGVKNG